MDVVLGAGITGLSISYHLGHQCQVFEKSNHSGGHAHSQHINGFTWDEGPHVSFTKHQYVKDLFADSVDGRYLEYPVFPENYYKGNWIPHPAQANLFAIPEPLRSECLGDFLSSRTASHKEPSNYKEWLDLAFGQRFSKEFAALYTKKYWTLPAEKLTTDWVGERVYYPEPEVVKEGYLGPQKKSKHYITSIRYPHNGGFYTYLNKLKDGAHIKLNHDAANIDLDQRKVTFQNGESISYERLFNTLPLPEFVKLINAPSEVKQAANNLLCSELILVNVVANHSARSKAHWLYVYDDDKLSTRISFTELLSPANGTAGKTGIQVEVYHSREQPLEKTLPQIIKKVCEELVEMGLVKDLHSIEEVNTQPVKYANVVFELERRKNMDIIYDFLATKGLMREADDLEAMTDWNLALENPPSFGHLVMAGRFAQWKYYWTDDCILRGLQISKSSRLR